MKGDWVSEAETVIYITSGHGSVICESIGMHCSDPTWVLQSAWSPPNFGSEYDNFGHWTDTGLSTCVGMTNNVYFVVFII